MTTKNGHVWKLPFGAQKLHGLLHNGLIAGVLGMMLLSCCSAPLRDKPVTLRFSTWGSAQEMAIIQERIAAFEAIHPRIHIEFIAIPENYFQKLHILAAGGLLPDVMAVNSLSFPVYAQNKLLMPLDAYLQTGLVQASQFFPAARTAFTWNKQLYAVPRDVSDVVVYLNLDRFKQAGVPVPPADWTQADFLRVAQRLTQPPDRFGVSFFSKPPLTWLPFVWRNGGDLFNVDLSHFTLAQPQAAQAVQFYADLRNRWHVAPTKIETGSETMSQLFLQGNLAMLMSGRWTVPVLRQQAKFKWDILPFPRGGAGSVVGIDASGYAMARGTAHPQEAWAWVAFLSSADSQRAFSQSGLIVPARQDIAHSTAFLTGPPAHAQYFITAMATGMPTHVPLHWDEIAETLGLALEPVFDGRQNAQDALTHVTPDIERLLK